MDISSRDHGPTQKLSLAVKTGSHLLAGIDSRVWVQVVGERRRTQWFRLAPLEGSFSRNAWARAEIELSADLHPGRPKLINVFHDATGSFKGWFLDEIKADDERFDFHCWLARDEAPYRTDASSALRAAARGYTLRVHTTELFLAGTDANVYVQLAGSKATTPWIRLWEPGVDNFVGGRTDTFRVFAEDVGDVASVWLRHDNRGLGAGWHVSWIELDGERHDTYRWLADDEGARRVDYIWNRRPLVRANKPLRFRLVTFADLHRRARRAAATDVGHLATILERFHIDVELLDDPHDLVFDGQWLAFDAQHSTTDSLMSALIKAVESTPVDPPAIDLFYVGGLEQGHGFYPGAARRPGGILIPMNTRRETTLAHEVGRYFGLGHSSGRVDPLDTESPRMLHNACDVIDGDPHNVMSHSKLPAAQQWFSRGQLQDVLLLMLEWIG